MTVRALVPIGGKDKGELFCKEECLHSLGHTSDRYSGHLGLQAWSSSGWQGSSGPIELEVMGDSFCNRVRPGGKEQGTENCAMVQEEKLL